MSAFSLGKPTYIGGEEVIVVRDVLGVVSNQLPNESLALVEPKGADGRPAIYVSENDLSRLRDDYPGIKVYGLWQVLFHNHAVNLGAPLITFPLKDKSGLYLLVDGGLDLHDPASITKSGEYLNGYIPDNYDVDMSTASVISADFANYRLPKQPAYTRMELSEKLKGENKRRWFVVGSLCGLIVVGAAASNYGLQTIYKSRMTDYSTKKTLITELDSRVRSLSAERLVVRPDDSVMLTQLFKVFELYPAAITPAPTDDLRIGFTATHMLITPPRAVRDPAQLIDGAKSDLQPDLSYRLVLTEPEATQDGAATTGAFQ
ncbi:hypothetical protein ACI77O_13210 [Pseudomonas tritici]|uniref:hypothetical protein n=1 Tax=Pseudomonas tritici TaxID=2745518 RepID=UPI00387AE1B3